MTSFDNRKQPLTAFGFREASCTPKAIAELLKRQDRKANVGAYHWLAGNFLKYSGPLQWSDLPVDSHELIAMCAPRPVFISAGKAAMTRNPAAIAG